MTSTAPARSNDVRIGNALNHCPICDSAHLEYEFIVDKSPVCGCQSCGLLFLNPQPTERLASTSDTSPADGFANLNESNAAERLQHLIAYCGLQSGKLLLIGTDAPLSAEAEKIGFSVTALSAAQFEELPQTELPRDIQVCVLISALEKMREPVVALRKIRTLLDAGGCLMVISPTTDSRAARTMRSSWWEFNRSNLFYHSIDTLQSLLIKAGFGDPIIDSDRTLVSVNYLSERLATHRSAPRRLRWLVRLASLSPVFRNSKFRLSGGRTRFLVRVKPGAPQPRLSVIVPVYNECSTFEELFRQLLDKTIDGVDLELIVVESNSTDGSRDLVLRYCDTPRVRVILEDRPRGKGHAVRTGLKAATGDIILFQDADLEYDLNDYDALVEPLLRFRNNFVLGSRHSVSKNSWKIRAFSDSPGLASLLNLGHLIFLSLFNLLYSQRLSDPFTMFKVLRRECLYGLNFECDRFDFDFEIVIKLLRKGYRPSEIPVNYKSRSIKEGKKVTMVRDPLTWIRALLKFRYSSIYLRK